MQQTTEGRLLPFFAAQNTFDRRKPLENPIAHEKGKAILLEPRSVRHQERVEDLFYLLFKRTGS